MARFYLSLQGDRSTSREVFRLAHTNKSRRASTTCASYSGAIECTPYLRDDGVDCIKVIRKPWQHSGGPTVTLFDGPVDLREDPRG